MSKQTTLGAHVSISGGIQNAVLRAADLNINCFQIFVKNNRQWHIKFPTPTEIGEFKKNIKEFSIKSVVAHATYLINLCSLDAQVREKSYTTLKNELEICDTLNIPYLVLHPGSGPNKEECTKMISQALNKIYTDNKINTKVLLETMAGQGESIGHTFENLHKIYDKIKNKNSVGFCFDTCHVFSAGYDIKTDKGFESILKEFDNFLGLENLKVFHINDSKKECGSKVDRHEHIGLGKIGIGLFEYIMNDERFIDIPKIIETPKNAVEDDIRNLQILKKLHKKT